MAEQVVLGEGTLIKDFPLAEEVADNDDMIIESDLPQTKHIKAKTLKAYMLSGDYLDAIYPVGSVYTSTKSTSPAELFGGTWTQITDVFLWAAGTSHAAGATGGSETKTLSTSNLPSHTHSIPSHTHSIPSLSGTAASAGSHTHTGPSHTHSLPSHTHSIPSHTHSIPSLSGTAASAGAHSHSMYYREDNWHGGTSRRYGVAATNDGVSTTAILSAGAHTHSVTTNSSTTGSYSGTSGSTSGTSGSSGTGNTGSSGAHTHSVTTTASTTGSTSGTSGSTGSGSALNIMPPYRAVYMWERVE